MTTKQTHLTICDNCKEINSSNNMIKCIHQDCDTYVHPICQKDHKDNNYFTECRKCSLETGIDFIIELCLYLILIFVAIYMNAQSLGEYIYINFNNIRIVSVFMISFFWLMMITYKKFIPCDSLPVK